jgi:hypothetical protein
MEQVCTLQSNAGIQTGLRVSTELSGIGAMIMERESLGCEFRYCSAYPTHAEALVDSQV